MVIMNETFYQQIEMLEKNDAPIAVAWDLAFEIVEMDRHCGKKFIKELNKYANEMESNNPYHNHVHLAQVILICAYLLKEEFVSVPERHRHFFPLMISANFHDIGHPGRPNKFVFELEYESVKLMNTFIHEHKLDSIWNEHARTHQEKWHWPKWSELNAMIKELILSTEFRAQSDKVIDAYLNHRDALWSQDNPIQINRLKMLLREGDILLSCLPKTGWNQSIKMMLEGGHTCENVKTLAGWKGFLEIMGNHYQSEASSNLGINVQIHQLKEDLDIIAKDEKLLLNPVKYLNKTGSRTTSKINILK
jgi:hypothetical protein